MKQIILVISLLCLYTLAAQAQDAKQAIRQHYADAKAQIAQIQELEKSGDQYPVPQTYTVVIKQNLPATGYHEETLQMFYREELESDEQIYADLYLDFATQKYNFAAREYYQEYLYDKQGRIEFIYAIEPEVINDIDYEYRFYFGQGRLIDVIVKSRKTGEGETAFNTVYQGKTVPAQYSEEYKSLVASSKSIMTVFKSIDSNRHL
ncbi:MAG: hypothetical protein J5658_01360 [Prevotella sp.]|nr:hypothetical protein [Prevotella sp.]